MREFGTDTPQQKLCALMVKLFGRIECCACCAYLRYIIDIVANSCDARPHVWGDFTWHKTADAFTLGPCGNRRGRIDHHVKQFALGLANSSSSLVVPSRQVAKLEDVNRASAVQWTSQSLCGLQAASHLSFAGPQAVGIVWDAARAGQPAKELNFCMAEKLGHKLNTVLPPAVFSISGQRDIQSGRVAG